MFKMQQKFQGTHLQQPNRKRHCEENKQKHFKTRKMLAVFRK